MNYHAFIKEARVHIITQALAETGGKVRPAAKLLGVHHETLYTQMRRLKIPVRPKPGYHHPLTTPEFRRFLGEKLPH